MIIQIIGDCIKGVLNCDHRVVATAVQILLHSFSVVRAFKDSVQSVLVLNQLTALTEGRVFHGGKPALRYQIPMARHVAEKIQGIVLGVDFTF